MPEVHLLSLGGNDSGGANLAALDVTHSPCLIGRHSACDLCLNDASVSRWHCALSFREGRVWVEDLRSLNGTRVNGEVLREAQALADGDRLELARLAFEVRLVGCPAEVAGTQEAAASSEPARQRQQVLVVEDDADVAQTLALLLSGWGHEVRVAHDGPEALEAAQARPPDTVLVDIGLPGMDGYEVAQRLRTQAGLEEARLVAVTGVEQKQTPDGDRGGVFRRLLLKPVAPEVLREVLTC